MPWPFSKKDKLAAPEADPRRARPSDPGPHNRSRRNESPGPGGRSSHREHSAPNYHYSRNRSPEYKGRRNSSFDDAYRSGRGLPPPRNYAGQGPPAGGNRMAIDMDPHGVQLKNADGSAIRMRHGGMDLTSAGGQTISVNTAGKNTCCGGGPCSHQMPVCHHGASSYTCYDPACLAGPRVVPAVHSVPLQQTYTTYTTQPAIAPMAIAAAPMTPVVQMPAQGMMQNIGGVPVVIPVNPRRR